MLAIFGYGSLVAPTTITALGGRAPIRARLLGWTRTWNVCTDNTANGPVVYEDPQNGTRPPIQILFLTIEPITPAPITSASTTPAPNIVDSTASASATPASTTPAPSTSASTTPAPTEPTSRDSPASATELPPVVDVVGSADEARLAPVTASTEPSPVADGVGSAGGGEAAVEGVLFLLPDERLPALDAREGNYTRVMVEVDGFGPAWTYVARPESAERARRGIAAGTARIRRDYMDIVVAAFGAYEGMPAPSPLPAPVVPLLRIRR